MKKVKKIFVREKILWKNKKWKKMRRTKFKKSVSRIQLYTAGFSLVYFFIFITSIHTFKVVIFPECLCYTSAVFFASYIDRVIMYDLFYGCVN